MVESKFKVGDKVRFKGGYELRFERKIDVGDDGTIVGKGYYDDDVYVNFGVTDDIPINDLELVAPTDLKLEFLERLQSLLRDFNAEICYREGDCELHIDLASEGKISRMSYPLVYPPFRERGYLSLTADDIMCCE